MKFSKSLFKKQILSVLAIGVFGLCTVFTIHFIRPAAASTAPFIASTTTAYPPIAPKIEQVNYGLPQRLRIPAIGVDARLESVGITVLGALGAPKIPANAGWYNQGPRPGEVGNSVIDGHFGYEDNIPAVFDNLSKLQKGDSLSIQDAQGTTITFVVSAVQVYAQNQNDSNIFISNDGKAHLNLITCQGDWSNTQQSYSDRLVVFADKVIN